MKLKTIYQATYFGIVKQSSARSEAAAKLDLAQQFKWEGHDYITIDDIHVVSTEVPVGC